MIIPSEGPPPAVLGAWVDESGSDPTRDPDTYLLAASVVNLDDVDDVRATMLGLRLTARKVHWKDEPQKRRERIIRTVVDLTGVEHTVVVLDGRPGERAERRRRLCMERLLFELDQRGVEHVTFEARAPSQNKNDRDMINALRSTRTLPPAMRVDHVPGKADPVLWIPDAVCGAVVAARTGKSQHMDVLEDKVMLVTIGTR